MIRGNCKGNSALGRYVHSTNIQTGQRPRSKKQYKKQYKSPPMHNVYIDSATFASRYM